MYRSNSSIIKRCSNGYDGEPFVAQAEHDQAEQDLDEQKVSIQETVNSADWNGACGSILEGKELIAWLKSRDARLKRRKAQKERLEREIVRVVEGLSCSIDGQIPDVHGLVKMWVVGEHHGFRD